MKTIIFISTSILFAGLISACSPEVGSEGWCNNMQKTPAAEWSAADAKAYAEHCLFKSGKK